MGSSQKQPPIKQPKTMRMAVAEDPNQQKAKQLFMASAFQRRGRAADMLTDETNAAAGSNGSNLGGGAVV